MTRTARPVTIRPADAALLCQYAPSLAEVLTDYRGPVRLIERARRDGWPCWLIRKGRGSLARPGSGITGRETGAERNDCAVTWDQVAAIVDRIRAERPDLLPAVDEARHAFAQARGPELVSRPRRGEPGTEEHAAAAAELAAASRALVDALRDCLRLVVRAPRGFEVVPMPARRPFTYADAVRFALPTSAADPIDTAAPAAAVELADDVDDQADEVEDVAELPAVPTRAELVELARERGRIRGAFGPHSWFPGDDPMTAELLAEHPEHYRATYDAYQRGQSHAHEEARRLIVDRSAVPMDETDRDADHARHMRRWLDLVAAFETAPTPPADPVRPVAEQVADVLALVELPAAAPVRRRPDAPRRGGHTAPTTVGRQLAAFVASARGRGPGAEAAEAAQLALFA